MQEESGMSDYLSPDEVEALKKITTPTVSNAIETFGVRSRSEGFMDSSIRCIFPELGTMVGYACTATIRAREPGPAPAPWEMWEAVLKTPEPRVVVIQDLDAPDVVGSYWGEVNGSTYKALGCVGVVTDGGVRDLPEVRATGFHFFAAHILVSHAHVHVVEFGGPVTVGGVTVSPGDLLHGDEHGVITIPHEIARDIPKAAAEIERSERRVIDFCRSPDFSADGLRRMLAGRTD
jgi:4-hydroxy-4-methyl-2-oxoglutarate aldolase